MALPMDEQRILDEMERMLAADDPRLAARLAAFGQPGFGQVLRTRRARATLSVMVLVLIAAVAAVIYMMSAFRSGSAPGRHPGQSVVSTPPGGRSSARPATSHVTASASANARPGLGRSAQTVPRQDLSAPARPTPGSRPAARGEFCPTTVCGPRWTAAAGRLQALAYRAASHP